MGVWSFTVSMSLRRLRDDLLAQRGQRLAAALDGAFFAAHRLGKNLPQHGEGDKRGACDQKIAFDLAERITRLQRIGRDVDDLCVFARSVAARHPRHSAVEAITTSAFGSRARIVKPRCIGWSLGMLMSRGSALHHRQREFLGQRRKRARPLRARDPRSKSQ